MKSALLVAVSALVGGLVGGLLIYMAVQDGGQAAVGPRSDVPPPSAGSGNGTPGPTGAGDPGTLTAHAGRLAASGRWREAQEAYLAVLLVDAGDQAAMRGLVKAQRALAKDNPDVLRRQVAEYRRAIASGLETEEHYTAAAMELLIKAGTQAIQEIRPSARRPRSAPQARPAAPPRPSTTPAPVRRAAPAPKPGASPAQPDPTPKADAPKADVPLDPTEPFLTVTVGPIASGERASLIAADLTVAGFSARAQRQSGGAYIILLGPYRVSEARRAANYVRSRFGQEAPVALTPVPDVRTR